VFDRRKTAKFFVDAFGYKVQTEFDLVFPDGSTTECIALEPPEKVENAPWQHCHVIDSANINYHLAPEIFVSDGPIGSIVGDWVAARNSIGGIHHLAYQVESVEDKMKEWKEKGYAEFLSENVLKCPEDDLVQVFTKPSELTGVIYEFISRGKHGFCKSNVKQLMLSTKKCL